MKKYTTSKGKLVDMDKLRLKNETTIAVGNMKVNTRGDVIDNKGKIVQTSKERTKPYYVAANKTQRKNVSLKADVVDAVDLEEVKVQTKNENEVILPNGDIIVKETKKKKKKDTPNE